MKRRFFTERLRERRNQVQHSTLSLARHLSGSASLIRAIEGGADPDRYELGFLDRYAQALGLSFDHLFEEDPAHPTPSGSGDDIALVVGLVHSATDFFSIDIIAETLEWPPERVRLALDDAEPALTAIGLRLVWNGDVAVHIVPDTTLTAPAKTAARRRLEADGLNTSEAAIIAALIRDGRRTRTDKPFVLQALLAADLVQQPARTATTRRQAGIRDALTLTDTARYNLLM